MCCSTSHSAVEGQSQTLNRLSVIISKSSLGFIPHILDGDSLLVCTATCDGKSAYLTAPILAYIDVRDDPDMEFR